MTRLSQWHSADALKLSPCQFKKEQDLLATILLKRASGFEIFSLSLNRKVKSQESLDFYKYPIKSKKAFAMMIAVVKQGVQSAFVSWTDYSLSTFHYSAFSL